MNIQSFISSFCTGLLLLTLAGCTPREVPVIDNDAQAARPATNMVVYECNERLFAETDAFKAIEAYVPELKRMGVDVLWLMPIHPRGADAKAIGSPYCVQNYRTVDPAFGTIDDLKHLVQTCHNNNIRVILDWIANHTSWDNPWVTAHPDWYEGPSTADEKFWADVTFLNYDLPAVRDTMKQCMLYWVNQADIDGFRCDYAGGVPLDWWKEVNEAIVAIKPNAFLLAETSDTRHFDAGFQLLYSWNYLYAIEDFFSGAGALSGLISASQSEYNATPVGKERLRYITTHDESNEKSPASVYRDAAGMLSAFCLTAFMGGVPMIYSSQEIGHTASIDFFHYNVLDFASANTTRDAMAKLMAIYHDTHDLRAVQPQVGSLAQRVAYVEYVAGEQALLVICNASNDAEEVRLPMRYEGLQMTNLISGEKVTLPAVTKLLPHEYRIYRK